MNCIKDVNETLENLKVVDKHEEKIPRQTHIRCIPK